MSALTPAESESESDSEQKSDADSAEGTSDAEIQPEDSNQSWTTLPRISDEQEVCSKCKKSCNFVYKKNNSYQPYGWGIQSEERFAYRCNACKELPEDGQPTQYYYVNGYHQQKPAKFSDDWSFVKAYVKVSPGRKTNFQQDFLLSHVSRSASTFVEHVEREPKLIFYPMHMSGDKTFRVLMKTSSMQVRYFRETAQAPHDAKLAQVKKLKNDTELLLAELRQALARNKTAFQEAVDGAANNERTELSDIGAMAIERKRIEREIERHQELLPSYVSQYDALKESPVILNYELERETEYQPQFYLQEGINQVDGKFFRLEQVHNAKPYTVACVRQTLPPKAAAEAAAATSNPNPLSNVASPSSNLNSRRVRSQLSS